MGDNEDVNANLNSLPTTEINFVSNNDNCTGISIYKFEGAAIGIRYSGAHGSGALSPELVYGKQDNPRWINQAYRTITFNEAPTGDLLTWLQANAVKQ